MFAKTSKTLRARACCNSFMAAVLLVLDVVLLVLVLAVVVALVLVVAAVLTLAVVALLVLELVVYEEVEVKVVDVLVSTDRLVSGVLVVLLVDVVVWRFLDL